MVEANVQENIIHVYMGLNSRDKAATEFVNNLKCYIYNIQHVKVEIKVRNCVEFARECRLDSEFFIYVNACINNA